MQITKKTFGQIILSLYVIGSLIFIGYYIWSNFKVKYTEQVFQNGQTDVLERVIAQAQNLDCQPFSVYTSDTEVQLVNVACVQSGKDTQTINQ